MTIKDLLTKFTLLFVCIGLIVLLSSDPTYAVFEIEGPDDGSSDTYIINTYKKIDNESISFSNFPYFILLSDVTVYINLPDENVSYVDDSESIYIKPTSPSNNFPDGYYILNGYISAVEYSQLNFGTWLVYNNGYITIKSYETPSSFMSRRVQYPPLDITLNYDIANSIDYTTYHQIKFAGESITRSGNYRAYDINGVYHRDYGSTFLFAEYHQNYRFGANYIVGSSIMRTFYNLSYNKIIFQNLYYGQLSNPTNSISSILFIDFYYS